MKKKSKTPTNKVHYFLQVEVVHEGRKTISTYTNDKKLVFILKQYNKIKNEDWVLDIWIVKKTETKEIFSKGEIENLPEWVEVEAEKYNL